MGNKVVKVITELDSIIFIVSFDDHFFTWEISEGDWINYWRNKAVNDKRIYLNIMKLSESRCDMFANDPVNDTVGASTGTFDTVEEALKYCKIL